MVAWEKEEEGGGFKISPIFIEIAMASRLAYVIIVPIFHGTLVDRRNRERCTETFRNYKSMSIYSVLNHNNHIITE